MSLDADYIVDRRRMRRKLTFWRIVTVLVAGIAIVGATFAVKGTGGSLTQTPGAQIARVNLRGIIRGDQDRVESLERLAKASSSRAVIVHIDSPGGTTAGSEQLYKALRAIAEKKPTVIVVDGMAASGGYIAAMAGDRIFAQETSLVGSIGVLFQFPNVAELLKTVGVKIEEVKSSPLKAAPNGYEPTSPEARAALESVVLDTYNWFRNMVRDRRTLDGDALTRVADGRVFTGRQGVDLKLVDELGDEQAAIDWLAKNKGIDAKLPVRDWRLQPRFSEFSFLHLAATTALNAVGLAGLAERVQDTGAMRAVERLNLDGLLVLWHPPG